ncbi:lysozyme-like [Cimex lectularius]|uniref:lysozyme n=1 Tax=Cimex lectularius TaxID=79782 RepID=A0A8I6TCL3_CIMLE|nr:lysozyme-like [Cimex lectularius]
MFALSSQESVGRMFAFLVSFLLLGSTLAKVFTPCELAEVLRETGKVPEEQISTWVCIARYESEFNSSAVGSQNGDGSNDHGIFQISDKYWCSPEGYACNVSCEQLTDDDLTDDVKCARRIYRQHQRLQGDGFKAWAVYQRMCSGDTSKFINNCSEDKKPKENNIDTKETKKRSLFWPF